MLVKNKTVSIIHLAFPRAGIPDEDLKKKYKGSKHQKGLTFLPGTNDVPPDLLELFKEHKLAQHLFEEGEKLEVLESVPKDEQVGLSKLKPGQAIKLVRDTIDRELLMRWAGEEEREEVLRELDKRLKKIAPPEGDENKKKTGEETA